MERFGSINLHRFVDERHLEKTWKTQYTDIDFHVPEQAGIDLVLVTAQSSIENKTDLRLPVAICSPRGRPPKDPSKRVRSWYESGYKSGDRKRNYLCSLRQLPGHKSRKCDCRQIS